VVSPEEQTFLAPGDRVMMLEWALRRVMRAIAAIFLRRTLDFPDVLC
jgi:hypothetical protein